MNWLKNLKIRHKLFIGFGAIILIFSALTIASSLTLNVLQTTVNEVLDVDVQTEVLALQSYRAVLEARRSEKDYLLRYKTLGFEDARATYVTRVETQTEIARANLTEIESLTDTYSYQTLQEMRTHINTYEGEFLRTVSLIEQRGHKDEGLIGEFREKVHEVETFVVAENLDRFTIQLLMIRRFEKDYLLRGEQGDIDDLRMTIAQFKEDIQTSTLTDTEKNQLTTLLTEYQTLFDELVQIDQEIANGIQNFRDAIHQLEAPLDTLYITAVTNKQNQRAELEQTMGLFLSATVGISLVAISLGYLIARATAKPLSRVLQNTTIAAERISQGDLDVSLIVEQKDELGDMATAFNQMIAYQQGMAQIAGKLAEGQLDVVITPQSEQDTLGKAFQYMAQRLRQLVNANEMQIWLANGRSELNDTMRGQPELIPMLQQVISYLCQYIEAQVGAIYLAQEDAFHLMGSYAFSQRKNLSNQYKLGEGLVGQAALEKDLILISNIPNDYIKVQSGLGETTPTQILVLPFLHENKVLGVLEIGTLSPFTESQITFLKNISENIAIAIHSANAREQVVTLLEQTQKQAEELQVQQEELRVTNEELSEQTNRLRASEEGLRKQQAELEATNAELEENTVALEEKQASIDQQNQKLRQATTELERKAEELALASKYKSEFLANMSHELRTPLNSLLILAHMLSKNEEKNLTPEQVESIQVIHNGGQDLLSLINEILDLAKVESGKIQFQLETIIVPDIVKGLYDQFVPIAQQKELDFSWQIEPNVPEAIETDLKRFKQILKNLLGNALKFTETGGVSLTVSHVSKSHLPNNVRATVTEKEFIAFAIQDSGIGITPEQQPIIFEAFQQADGGINRKFGGTGLGLSISRELAQNLGGGIGLTSVPNQGSTFTLYLPTNAPATPSIMTQPAKKIDKNTPLFAPKPTTTPTKPTKQNKFNDDRAQITAQDKTLLVIEDDPNFARVLYNFSHKKGFQCLLTDSGEEGIQLAEQYLPKGIILDLNLPTMSGWEILELLKKSSTTRHIPVHIMSVYDTNSMNAHKRGAIGYITKPVSQIDLDQSFATIEGFIDRKISKLLLVEDDDTLRLSVKKLLAGEDVHIIEAKTGQQALNTLQEQHVDCMILDLSLPDISGFEVLQKLNQQDGPYYKCPVIVYTGQELSREESEQIMQYADNIIIKGVKSPERLLDETALFLHRVISDLPQEQQETIRQLYHKETHLEGKRILVVDDDMRNSFALSKLLSEWGIHVNMARNGQKALEVLAEQDGIDLILMDIMMPVMDGLETTRRIRQNPQFSNLPILALTAKAMKGDREACITAGANDYLSKPIDVDRLFSMLRVWLY